MLVSFYPSFYDLMMYCFCVLGQQPGVGTWCESGQVSANDVLRIESDVRTELAATLPGSPCTAYRLLRDFAQLSSGDVIFQSAGGSPVGSALVQLASSQGVRVVSLVSESARDYAPTVERLKLLGSEVAVGESYAENVGVKAVLDDLPQPKLAFHGGDKASSVLLGKLIPKNCPIVTYPPGITDTAVLQKVIHFSLADWLRNAKANDVEVMVSDVVKRMKDGSITSWLQRVPFGELSKAIENGGVCRRKLVAVMQEAM